MLKHQWLCITPRTLAQPPSGGCVLKRSVVNGPSLRSSAAAFRRLCVETHHPVVQIVVFLQPPSGGCVLKQKLTRSLKMANTRSRLQAAVC